MSSIVEARILGPDDAARVFRRLGGGVDGLLALGLDCERAVTGLALNPTHRAFASVRVWELVNLAAELDTYALVLARFPRAGKRAPSTYEANSFVDLAERAARAHVHVLDCLVLRPQQWWSLAVRSRPRGEM